MLQSFAGLNQQLRDKIARMANLKTKAQVGDKDTMKNLEVLQKECLMLFTFLRNLSRRMRIKREDQKRSIEQMQGRLEKTTLKVKNSAYETAMLKKAIHLESDFESAHGDIDIISVQEFKDAAPAHFQKWSGDHDLTIKRLTFELQERQRLEKEAKVVEEQVTDVKERNKDQEDTLKGIQTRATKAFDNIIAMTEELDIPQSVLGPDDACSELPKPLYNAFHLCHYQKLSSYDLDKNVELAIEGEIEDDAAPGEPPKKRRKLDAGDIHPMSMNIRFKDLGAQAQMQYSRSNRMVLVDLMIDFEGTGTYKKQHPRALEKLFAGHKAVPVIAGGKACHAFSWAQELGGVPAPSTSNDTPRVNLRTLRDALKARVESIKNFKIQLDTMTKYDFVPEAKECLPGPVVKTVFRSFTSAEAEKTFRTLPFGGQDVSKQLVYFYDAKFSAQPAGKSEILLQAVVGVPPDYPEARPVIRCKMIKGDVVLHTHLKAGALDDVKAMIGDKGIFETAREKAKAKLAGSINVAKMLQILINNDFSYTKGRESALASAQVSLMLRRLLLLFDKIVQRVE